MPGMRPALVLAVAGCMLLFAGLSLWEMSGDSLTSDERVHLPAGYVYWKTGDFRLNPEHPPLMKLFCAAPLLALGLHLPPTTPEAGQTFHDYQPTFGARFLFSQDFERILFWGRLPAVAVGLVLLGFLFAWSREMHGSAIAGLLTLALASLEPTLLAHSHLVADDVALATFGMMAYYFLWRFGRGGALRDLLLATLGLGLALASKFSAIFQLPLFLILAWVTWPRGGLVVRGRARPENVVASRPVVLAGMVLVMIVIVQAAYLFSTDPMLYLKGIQEVRANRPAINPVYVHGAFYDPAPFWYPLYAFLLKTPLPTLAAQLGGILLAVRSRGRTRGALAFLILPAALHAAVVCGLAYNYGQRYLLPMTAFLLVPAGGVAALLGASRARRAVGALCAVWLLVSVLHAAPNQIAYFNELIGGPANGPYFLSDSNLDWGQDLKRLARYQREKALPEITLAYWGPGQPEYYGIRWHGWAAADVMTDRPAAGVYAISVNRLVELKRRVVLSGDSPSLDWLERFRPTARVGGSILIYDFRESPR